MKEIVNILAAVALITVWPLTLFVSIVCVKALAETPCCKDDAERVQQSKRMKLIMGREV